MKRSYEFTDALVRYPGHSVVDGLRDSAESNPDASLFRLQHAAYIDALESLNVRVIRLAALEEFPDSVFVEDAALCIGNTAIALRPGAPTRAGESKALKPELSNLFKRVIDLPGAGSVDGGDVLLGESEAFVGLSARTTQAGIDALSDVLRTLGYTTRQVHTPSSILHFKTACGLLDEATVFATKELAETGCFEGYRVIESIPSENAAANLIRVNGAVLCSTGFPLTVERLKTEGYTVLELDTSEAAKVDGGLSCMSLRFNLAI